MTSDKASQTRLCYRTEHNNTYGHRHDMARVQFVYSTEFKYIEKMTATEPQPYRNVLNLFCDI